MRPLRKARMVNSPGRSEEHTSELQSLRHLVCRLLLEKKNEHVIRVDRMTSTKNTSRLLNHPPAAQSSLQAVVLAQPNHRNILVIMHTLLSTFDDLYKA